MRKRIVFSLLAALIALSVLAGTVMAQGPVVQHTGPAWEAWYWNNTDLTGSAALHRFDTNIDFNWGAGSPDGVIASNGFSARWSRYIDTAGGNYRFTASSDDGIRVSVDGRWIINEWHEHPTRTYAADVSLSSGHHLVIVEYYENAGDAVAQVSWAPASTTISNWRAEYYNNKTLSNDPVLVRDDAQINFDWGAGSPAPGVVPVDAFSVRWTRTLNLAAGTYRFSATVDDGVRLWVNGHLLIDVWMVQAPRTYTGDLYLPGGSAEVKMEYFEEAGGAVARLSWTGGGTLPPPPPPPAGGEVIVDDVDPGFVKGGTATSWRTVNEGYNGRLTWTRNNDRARANYNWARWYPHLAAGRYEVYVYIPERYTTTASARYWVAHAGGFTQRIVNQSTHGSQWVSLGTYQFSGTDADYVSLSDVTYEPYVTRLIGFDAVKWVPR